MLNKGAIVETPNYLEEEFSSNPFLVEKSNMGNRPVITLKHLNQFLPYQHFKMESLHRLQNILKKEDYKYKLDLKDAYCSVPLNPASIKFVWFLWSGKLYEFLCLCFGLGPAPRIFTKLLKIPVSVLRRLNILVIIYLDEMLLIGHTSEEKLMARDTAIFLLQQRVTVGSLIMTLSLPEKKVSEVQKQCQELLQETTSVDFRINKTNRLIVFNYSSSTSSTNKFQVLITKSNTSIKNTGVAFQKSDSKQKLQGKTAVVDKKFENLQWSFLDLVSQSSADTNKCIQKGMEYQQREMVKGETVVTHKCIRTETSKIRTLDLQQTKHFDCSSFSNRQHHCTTLSRENGGNREQYVTEIKERNLAVFLELPDHNYCRIPSKFFEYGGRLAISKPQGLIKMELLPQSISTSLPE